MTFPKPPAAAPHSDHDLVLLAAAADRDAGPALRDAAAAQTAACPDCAALSADLRSLTRTLADLPPTRAVPRDMRISAAKAAELRRGGLWRRLLRPFGSEGIASLRPLAAALTTLGLAGILLTAIPFGFGLGGAASAPYFNSIGSAAGQAVSAAPVAAVPKASEAPAPEDGDTRTVSAASAQAPETAPDMAVHDGGGTADQLTGQGVPTLSGGLPQLSPLAWISLVLIVAGIGLFALRFIARRIA